MPSNAHTAGRQKELGAYYTPREMADVLVDWCIRSAEDTMIDPSFGGLVFLESARDRLVSLGRNPGDAIAQLCGIDVDPTAAAAARHEAGLDGARLIESDFFEIEPDTAARFTANVGNPPYVRYQGWDAEGSRAHAIAKAEGAPLTKLASLWAPFIIHGCRFLEPGGRMGQVLPAELLHAQYAEQVVKYLTRSFSSLTIAMFEDRVFPGALQEVILLFAEGYGQGPAPGIGVLHAKDLAALDVSRVDGQGEGYLNRTMGLATSVAKRTASVYETLAQSDGVLTLGDIAVVNIGVVTGANDFFLVTDTQIEDGGYDRSLFHPVIGKAMDLQGARLSKADMKALAGAGRRTNLLLARADNDPEALASIADLIAQGEEKDLQGRYKCRIRDPWWAVPVPKSGIPGAFLTYMSDAFPRLAANSARALSTNTIHNVLVKKGVDSNGLAVAFYNSLTLLSAEFVGRSYGGGLLKLEPTEATRLLIPRFDAGLGKRLAAVDKQLRAGDLAGVLEENDRMLLEPLGLKNSDLVGLRAARQKLLDRRRARSKPA